MVPRGCFTELLQPQLKEIPDGWEVQGWLLELLPGLPAGFLETWAGVEDP